MSWLDLVKPKITTRKKRDVQADIWTKCSGCGEMNYKPDLEENQHICSHCGYHMRVPMKQLLDWLLDDNSVAPIEMKKKIAHDPLKFKDSKKYTDRLKSAQKKTGEKDAAHVMEAKIKGSSCIVCAFDFSFMGGSMGAYVGEAIVLAAETAAKRKLPLLLIPSSGGARMQEGILSLMQMARTTAAILKVKEAGLPYVVLLTHPTTGGVTASFAMLGDITLAEPGALIGFAGPRVIKETIGEKLPEGFQTAEYLLEHGMIDMVVPRPDQPATLAQIFSMLTHNTQQAPNGKEEK